jgi:hypothetical protein|tara:strand:+ start:292 stop:483 length:192 start_codon:yes stop_codon:yes gene_type:complete
LNRGPNLSKAIPDNNDPSPRHTIYIEYIEATDALSHEKWELRGNKKTPKLSPAPLLSEVIIKQ